ncbi:MAG: DUF2851 family protein [Bacteroidota bacterium]
MKEAFLQHCWQHGWFDGKDLQTADREPIRIVHRGEHNTHAGPDFLNARLRIGNTLWAGNVEIHTRSSEWYRHGHERDPAYNNVILHVVYDHDLPVSTQVGFELPVLELSQRLDLNQVYRYQRWMENAQWIPCQQHLADLDNRHWKAWLYQLVRQRLSRKAVALKHLLDEVNHDWEAMAYMALCRSFGFKVNAEPFERLARNTPWSVVRKHASNRLQLEALLLGQAGFLDGTIADDYPHKLQREYQFLRHKFGLTPMPRHSWKTMRMRPANRPAIRLAQLAAVLHHLTSRLTDVLDNAAAWHRALEAPMASYWQSHHAPDQPARRPMKGLGADSRRSLLINTVAPLHVLLGQMRGRPELETQAIALLKALPPEHNAQVQRWRELGLHPANAAESQALLDLKANYCSQKKCLNCRIGVRLLRA